MGSYILAIDQSTQGTKALLFDRDGRMAMRTDRLHRQIVNEKGWVEHDPAEILQNTLAVCREVVDQAKIDPADIAALGISNQRETSLAWNGETGECICNAIVWQCARAAQICERHARAGSADIVKEKTGIPLSPYFPASKFQWIMENIPLAGKLAGRNQLCLGTVDSWLIYQLTGRQMYKTDYSNASRTQLFNLQTLSWDKELMHMFAIPANALPEVCMSDSVFGLTDIGGFLKTPVPICGVLGDSHGALFGQNCRSEGEIKATYGTGSSVMMNIGNTMRHSETGLVTSLAWGMNGKVEYCFEGNLNYTGAVMTWLKDDVGLIENAAVTSDMAMAANPEDRTYFVPAFSGLGAPYWDSNATGMFTGITRTTGKNEMVKACVESIAYQIMDLVELMREETDFLVRELHVDGGPTANQYLMQFQSDMAGTAVMIPQLQELSGMGAAYMAGISCGLYDADHIFGGIRYHEYRPQMEERLRMRCRAGWKEAIRRVLMTNEKQV